MMPRNVCLLLGVCFDPCDFFSINLPVFLNRLFQRIRVLGGMPTSQERLDHLLQPFQPFLKR